MEKSDLLPLVKEVFKGRTDVIAQRFGKPYYPLCANIWKKDVCPMSMKSGSCSACKVTAYIPFSDKHLEDHIAGKKIHGVYPLLKDNTCHFIAADFDDHEKEDYPVNPLLDVEKYYYAAYEQDLDCYVLRSKSGKGYHVYIFFKDPVPAMKARTVVMALLKEAQVIGDDVINSSFDKFFPTQDKHSDPDSIGNLIALPFQGIAMQGDHTVILDPDSGFKTAYADQVEILSTIKYATEADLDRVINEWGLSANEEKPVTSPIVVRTETIKSFRTDNVTIDELMKCAFLKHAYENQASLSEPLWYAMVSNIACLSPNGEELCHEFSKGHPNYNKAETDRKIRHSLQDTKPHTCKHIKEKGFKCLESCKVKSPAGLFHRIDRTLGIGQAVQNIVPKAPVDASAVIPAGWSISGKGVISKVLWDKKEEQWYEAEILPIPVFLTERYTDVNSGMESIKLCWIRDGKPSDQILEKHKIADTKKIVELSGHGLPINSINAKSVVEYLAAYDNVNYKVIPEAKVSSFLGWQGDSDGFLCGDRYYSDSSSTGQVSFSADDQGNDQIAKGFKTKGDFNQWLKAVKLASDYPVAVSSIYFSLLPPLLKILEVQNFIVDYCNTTSTGKTTTLALGASTWGNPDNRSSSSLVRSWETTRVNVERTASLLNDLPMYMDDTKLAGTGNARDAGNTLLSRVIYLICSGVGKGRGSIKGLGNRGSWRTVLLTNGESPIVNVTQDGGQRGRVLSLWGSPFSATNNITATKVNQIKQLLMQNYGHVGYRWIEYIMANKQNWSKWVDLYRQEQNIFSARAGDDPVAIRLSEYITLLSMAISLIHEAIPELRFIDKDRLVDVIWDKSINNEKRDMTVKALEALYSWAVSNQTTFWGKHAASSYGNNSPVVPHSGWSGKWDEGYIAFTKSVFMRILKDDGFDGESMIRTFEDRGWLVKNKKGNGKSVKIMSESIYCYAIKLSAITEVLLYEKERVETPSRYNVHVDLSRINPTDDGEKRIESLGDIEF